MKNCSLCGHGRTMHQGADGCWGGTWSDCGCAHFDDGKPKSTDIAVAKARLEGLIDKRRGQETALETVADWQVLFRQQVMVLAATRLPFTSEDVLAVVGLPSGGIGKDANNAVGAMMTALAREGLIRKTGRRVQSRRPSSHGAELTEWEG